MHHLITCTSEFHCAVNPEYIKIDSDYRGTSTKMFCRHPHLGATYKPCCLVVERRLAIHERRQSGLAKHVFHKRCYEQNEGWKVPFRSRI